MTEQPQAQKAENTTGLAEQFAKAGEAAQEITEAEQLKALGLPPTVKIETADEPLDLVKADPNAEGPWIQYDGIATVRTMTPEAWRECGVKSDKCCEWNYLNKKRLPRSLFNDAELQYLLRRDGRFSLVED